MVALFSTVEMNLIGAILGLGLFIAHALAENGAKEYILRRRVFFSLFFFFRSDGERDCRYSVIDELSYPIRGRVWVMS